MIDANAMKPF